MNSNVLQNLRTVAQHLETLGLGNMVFVGGATIGLLLTDKAAPPPRITFDVDVVVDTPSRSAYYRLEETLRERGYQQPPEGPICRWVLGGVLVDLMPVQAGILGFSNRWYSMLLEHAQSVELEEGLRIPVASAPYLLASKLEAFRGRGEGDYLESHDIEDILVLLDGRAELLSELGSAPEDVRHYVAAAFGALLDDPFFIEAITAHLLPDAVSQAREGLIVARMRQIASLAS